MAYEKYIKGKNYVSTSFVPKGEVTLVAENAVNAGIVEEDVTKAAEVKGEPVAEEPIVKTPTKTDRSQQPPVGPDPEVTIPPVWTGITYQWNEDLRNYTYRTATSFNIQLSSREVICLTIP